MAGNFFSNIVSDIGRNINAPVIFDWDTNAAREDLNNRATNDQGNIKRDGQSSAAANQQLEQDAYWLNRQAQTIPMGTVGGSGKVGGGNTGQITSDPQYTGAYGSTGGSTAPRYTARDEQAAYDDQISALEQLLGYTNTKRDAGLASMTDRFNSEKRTLDDQYTRAQDGYRVKETENAQAKERGLGEVDSFASSSYKNLQRLLQGGNAGSSSVARELMPYLVSKAATTRRTGVFDTSGQNARNIDMAKQDAEYQYGTNSQDLENSRKSSEQTFRENILNKQNELGGSLRDLQIKRAMANGQGYAQARAAGDAAQAGITDRQNQLASLFGQYKPTFTAKAMNTKTPDLGKYTVDKASINSSNSNLPAESSYYQTMLKKKQELGY